MYCGVIGSSSSVPAARPIRFISIQLAPGDAQSFNTHIAAIVHVRIVDESLPTRSSCAAFSKYTRIIT